MELTACWMWGSVLGVNCLLLDLMDCAWSPLVVGSDDVGCGGLGLELFGCWICGSGLEVIQLLDVENFSWTGHVFCIQ